MVNDATVRHLSESRAERRRLCIGIPTFRRPTKLADLLRGIAGQALPFQTDVEVVVFDNDLEPSAEAIVAAARDGYPVPLNYVHVTEPGLSSVRNAALAYARERFHFLVTIDDDECPQPQWLGELVRVQLATRADIVIGPVPQLLPDNAPKWLREGRFLDLPVYSDMAAIDFGYSGNCLMVTSSVNRFAVAFDSSLNFAGGEDMLFFKQLVSRGARLAYAARAIAPEAIDAERISAAYVLKLNFRRGNTLSICDRRLGGGQRMLVFRACKAVARLGLGSMSLIPLAVTRGRTGVMMALCNIALGLGALSGLAGHTYHAYRRDDAATR